MEDKSKIVQELEITKKKYKRIKNILLIVLCLIVILGTVYYTRKYIVLSKVLRANYSVNLGKNYKITEYMNGLIDDPQITYYKDGVCKTGSFSKDGHGSYFYLTENEKYFIHDYIAGDQEYKTYRVIEKTENYDPERVYLFGFFGLLSEPKEITTKEILDYTFIKNIKISKEEYRGKEYITLQSGIEKWYANPDTYYIEKKLFQGQTNERIIEQGVVTTETELPDLSTYINVTDNK